MITLGLRQSKQSEVSPDRRLINALTGGEPDARDAIRSRYWQPVLAEIHRLVGPNAPVAEIAEDAFTRLWSTAGRFDPDRTALGAYLQIIATGQALDWVRSEAARRTRDGSYAHASAGGRTEVAEVRWAVESLPDPERRAIWLASSVGLNYRQVAIALAVPEPAAKAYLRTGLQRLHDLIGLDDATGAAPSRRRSRLAGDRVPGFLQGGRTPD
jgi:RNA polymerase sigma-70 factor (ECF subfamily)